MKNILIIGSGKSGIGACRLALQNNYNVKITDVKKINSKIKKTLYSLNVPFEEEGHSSSNLDWADEIIISPGVSDKIKFIQLAKKTKIPIYSEIEFACRFTKKNIIAITGTNGKTTTCSLLFHILKTANLNPRLCGNIGVSFSERISLI